MLLSFKVCSLHSLLRVCYGREFESRRESSSVVLLLVVSRECRLLEEGSLIYLDEQLRAVL